MLHVASPREHWSLRVTRATYWTTPAAACSPGVRHVADGEALRDAGRSGSDSSNWLSCHKWSDKINGCQRALCARLAVTVRMIVSDKAASNLLEKGERICDIPHTPLL